METAGPSYLACFPAGGLRGSVLAEFLAQATNRYTGVASTAAALVSLEHSVIRWLCTEFGLPEGSGGIFTTGASLAALSVVHTARQDRLGVRDPNGTIYVTPHTHHCVAKAAHIPARTHSRRPHRHRTPNGRRTGASRDRRRPRERTAPVPDHRHGGRDQHRHRRPVRRHRRAGRAGIPVVPRGRRVRQRVPADRTRPRDPHRLHLHGVAAFREALDEKHDLADHLRAELAKIDGIEVLPSDLTVVVFRSADSEQLIKRLNESGGFFLSSARLGGRFTLRICVLSPRSHREHVDELIELVKRLGRS